REAVSETIPLKAGRLSWTPDGEFPEVQVQGLVRKRDDFWSVTLFLVNGQQEPKKLRDSAWVFQPELIVESPGKEAIFHSRPQQKDPGKSDPVNFAEEQEMAMLYRHHVEFGVGHGVSIHAECPDGICDKASTTAKPRTPSDSPIWRCGSSASRRSSRSDDAVMSRWTSAPSTALRTALGI